MCGEVSKNEVEPQLVPPGAIATKLKSGELPGQSVMLLCNSWAVISVDIASLARAARGRVATEDRRCIDPD